MILKAVEKDYQTNWKGTAAYACQQSNEIKTLGSGPEHFIFANLGRRNILHNIHKFILAFYLDQHRVGLACFSPAPDPPHHGKGITAITTLLIYKTRLVRKRVCALFRPIFIFTRVAELVRRHKGPSAKSLKQDKNFKPSYMFFLSRYQNLSRFTHFLEIFGQKKGFLGQQQCCLGKKVH